jgi:hypothetical protein
MVSQNAIANEEDLLPATSVSIAFKGGASIELTLDKGEYKEVRINAFGRSYDLPPQDLAKLSGLGLSPYYVTQGAFYGMDGELDGAMYFRFVQLFAPAEEKPKTVTVEAHRTGQLKLR